MSGIAFVLFFGLVLWFLPAALVYVHAKNRNRDALLWGAVVLVGGLLGVLLYAVLGGFRGPVIETSGQSVTCPECSHRNQAGDQYCGNCGTALSIECRSCGHQNRADNGYCSECGNRLGRGTGV